MKKPRKKIRAATAASWLLLLATIGGWLLSMGLLTVILAQEIYDGLYEASYQFTERVERFGTWSEFYDPESSRYGLQHERPDFLEYEMLDSIAMNTKASRWSGGNYYYDWTGGQPFVGWRNKLIRMIGYDAEAAVLYYDGEGNLLHSSEEDILYFSYYTQEEWEAGEDRLNNLHYGWIDISEGKGKDEQNDPYHAFRAMYAEDHSLFDIPLLRVTGWFEGTELKPVTMHYVTWAQIWQVTDSPQFSDGYTYSDVDRAGLRWELQFDHSADYPDRELVTVYLERPDMWNYEENPLTYQGGEYASIADLAKQLDFPSWAEIYQDSSDMRGEGIYDLTELLVFSGRRFADHAGSAPQPETEFVLVTAVRSNPLLCAMEALRNIYIISFLLTAALFLILRALFLRQLIRPVAAVNAHIAEGWTHLSPYPGKRRPSWAEGAELIDHYGNTSDTLRKQANEINRLKTALDYAKTAEANRRQMTSNIAHELKTPLAVIHSYAEGLKENIAGEKREKYLDTILAEAEKTDAMVLEMLDLSRLEAGKVKLSRDEFSITEIVKETFRRLDLTVQGKGLLVTFDMPENCVVTADEARIAQVIENFASNAVKYTPAGGSVRVKLSTDRAGTVFSVANDSKPFSQEELAKVWEAFYRVDESRSSAGTGLGLTIAKSIIELHGGSCAVCNTDTGVEFSFRIV